MEHRSKIKIAMLCLPGLESFLQDIVDYLASRYQVRTCYSVDPQEIRATIQWSDVVWLEWANEMAIGVSNNPQLLNTKKVICRLHSYEAFEDYLEKIDWRKIDDLVFVAPHIREIAVNRIPDLAARVKRMTIIPNGVDLQRFTLTQRKRGYHLAFIGDINYKKGPMLLLHAFHELVRVDPRYRLHFAGRLQNIRYGLYFSQMIKELGLEHNIQMDGWVEDIQNWLEDKQYIVCSSVLEGHPVGIMEAMACGLKPVIHNFVGARRIYPDDFLWNTIPDFIHQVVSESYDSAAYREYIRNHFSLKRQLETIDRLILDRDFLEIDEIQGATGPGVDAQHFSEKTSPSADQTDASGLHSQVRETLEKCIRPGMKALVVGCGTGELAAYVDKLGAQTVCIDESGTLIHQAQRLSKHHHIKFCRCDYENLQLGECFDLIAIDRILEEWPRPRISRLLASIARHALDSSVIYLNMTDGRYMQAAAVDGIDNHRVPLEYYTPDVVLGLFAEYHLQSYHIEFYGVDAPAQYNGYLFASEKAFRKTYRRQTASLEKSD